jgi:hypothetical protein
MALTPKVHDYSHIGSGLSAAADDGKLLAMEDFHHVITLGSLLNVENVMVPAARGVCVADRNVSKERPEEVMVGSLICSEDTTRSSPGDVVAARSNSG